MELILHRTPSRKTCTIGMLIIEPNSTKECYILENVVNEVIGEAPAKWKNADGRNAIPVGKYQIDWTYSPHFKCYTPELRAVPGFSGVRIHGGNRDTDSEGCLITGSSIGIDGESVTGSDIARDALYMKIHNAIINGDAVWITVVV